MMTKDQTPNEKKKKKNSSTNKGRKKLKIKVVVQVCPETSKFYYRRFLSFIIDLSHGAHYYNIA